ncbi:SHOCT domain-containing protein [Streptomyces sp. NPDC018693]|uniref:SHOCT domain-containing protein n=1 Tax=unclassified Streptomyces TaxID=2593676 RepID=UPI00379E4CBD
MYWDSDHGMNGWGWFAMSISSVLFLALLVAVGMLLYRALSRDSAPPRPPVDAPPHATAEAERLLGERFARGEIDEEEYRRRLAVLRGGGAGLAKT